MNLQMDKNTVKNKKFAVSNGTRHNLVFTAAFFIIADDDTATTDSIQRE